MVCVLGKLQSCYIYAQVAFDVNNANFDTLTALFANALSGMLVLATLWVFFMPSLTALAVLMIFIGMLGVFVGNDFSSKEKISQT